MHNTVAPINLHSSINGIGISRRSNVCPILTNLVRNFLKHRCNREQRQTTVYVSSVRSHPKSK